MEISNTVIAFTGGNQFKMAGSLLSAILIAGLKNYLIIRFKLLIINY
jgi:hypothetical protein